MINQAFWQEITQIAGEKNTTVVAVSKTKPVAAIQALYTLGHRDFGENYVQELVEKQSLLPDDIRWHYIGHLQTNKVKYIAPFVHLIHAVDSIKLLQEINKQAARYNRVIDVLLQLHIATETSKFGMNQQELDACVCWYQSEKAQVPHIRICGLMGMASFTDEDQQVRTEFRQLRTTFLLLQQGAFSDVDYFTVCSIGMSGDYRLALEEGSTMLRIGSLLFGSR